MNRVILDEEDWLERIVDSGMLDGVLVIGQSNQFEALERVAQYYRPMVVWGSHAPGQKHLHRRRRQPQGRQASGRLPGPLISPFSGEKWRRFRP